MRIVLTGFLSLFIFSCFGQSILDSPLVISQERNLIDFLNQVEQKHTVKFFYVKDWLEGISLTEKHEDKTLRNVLDNLFLGTKLNYIELNPHAIIFVMDPNQSILRHTMINEALRGGKNISRITIGNKESAQYQKQVALEGIIVDSKTKQPLIGASIQTADSTIKSVTNEVGSFRLNIPVGLNLIKISYVNYEEKVVDMEVYSEGKYTFQLDEVPVFLEEVVIHGGAAEINAEEIGLTSLNITELKKAPSLLGEADIIKQIQLLPGVTSVGEAASGFNVRGGSADQNLILYDNLPIFNSSHVFGFFSSFNTEAVRDVSFYKGGMPAEYGGRASSILDIKSREGNLEKWRFQGGIGIISSNILVEGPIKKNENSVSFSFRNTYSDWMLKTIPRDYIDLSSSSVSFYDATFKFTQIFSPKSKFLVSLYKSHDQFKLQGDSTFRWDTMLGSIRWDQQIASNFSLSLTAGIGTYSYSLSEPSQQAGFDLTYNITYPTFKLDFLLDKFRHKISFGVQTTYYDFNPGTLTPSSQDSNRPEVKMEQQRSVETGVYLSDHITLFAKVFLDLGVRVSMFQSIGPGNVYLYKPDAAKEVVNITDTLSFSSGEKIRTFSNFEPRLGIRLELSTTSSIKIGYQRIYQYLHLVTNSTSITPVDIWQPSGYYFEPQEADQISIGYFKSLRTNGYEYSVETYYKRINNILDFKDGAQLILNPQLETDFLQGEAEAYGVETQLTKKTGRLVGSINYTFSRSFSTIKGGYPSESINNGDAFPANFDQPHIINLNWKYSLSKRFFFTGGFTYHTGRPISLPLSAFYVDNTTVTSFSQRNQYRIPDYHRLDLGLVIEGTHKRKKLLDGTWTFSIYNVYARKNPYTIYFQEVRPGILRPYRLSIIGTAIPSISYNFKL